MQNLYDSSVFFICSSNKALLCRFSIFQKSILSFSTLAFLRVSAYFSNDFATKSITTQAHFICINHSHCKHPTNPNKTCSNLHVQNCVSLVLATPHESVNQITITPFRHCTRIATFLESITRSMAPPPQNFINNFCVFS